jgi:hypothetical protein
MVAYGCVQYWAWLQCLTKKMIMDIKKILSWIVDDSINGEFLYIIDVPEEGDESYEQNEEWWISMLGACPPYPVKPGKYLYFCTDSISLHAN